MSGCLSCCKLLCCCLLVITNIFFIITGIILALLGVVFTFGFSMLSSSLKQPINEAAKSITDVLKSSAGIDIDVYSMLTEISVYTGTMGILFIIFGIILIVVACIGCCGACCSVKYCLIIYAVFVGIAFLAQLCVVIIWFADSEVIKSNVKTAIDMSVSNFKGFNGTDIYSFAQNMVQVFIGCCGSNNGTDFYTMASGWNRLYTTTISGVSVTWNLSYPITCCKFNLTSFTPINEYCPYNNTTPETSNYQRGCYSEIFNFIERYFELNILFYALGGALGYQVLLFLGSIIIIQADRKSNKVKPR